MMGSMRDPSSLDSYDGAMGKGNRFISRILDLNHPSFSANIQYDTTSSNTAIISKKMKITHQSQPI